MLVNCKQFVNYVWANLHSFNGQRGFLEPRNVETVLSTHRMRVDLKSSSLSRAIYNVRMAYLQAGYEDYNSIASLLRDYSKMNAAASTCLQLDSSCRFFRLFVTVPDIAEVLSNLCYPMVFVDGANCTATLYDGCLLTASATLGDGSALLLATAWVPTETKRHYCWFLDNLRKAGIDLGKLPLMTDRGVLLSVVNDYLAERHILLSLKYCVEDILRKIESRFSFSKTCQYYLRSCVQKLSGASTFQEFVWTLSEMERRLGKQGPTLVLYLLRIHPRHYTVFANRESILDEQWMPWYLTKYNDTKVRCGEIVAAELTSGQLLEEEIIRGVPIGKKFPMFGNTAENNISKQMTKDLKTWKATERPPAESLPIVMEKSLGKISRYTSSISDFKCNFTTTGCVQWVKSMDMAQELHDRCHPVQEGNVTLFTYGGATARYKQEDGGSVTCNCAYYETYQLQCGHIFALMCKLKEKGISIELPKGACPKWNDVEVVKRFVSGLGKFQSISREAFVPFFPVTDTTLPPPSHKRRKIGGARRALARGEERQSRSLTSLQSTATTTSSSDISWPGAKLDLTKRVKERLERVTEKRLFEFYNRPVTDEELLRTLKVLRRPDLARVWKECAYCKSREHDSRWCPTLVLGGHGAEEECDIDPGTNVFYQYPVVKNMDNRLPYFDERFPPFDTLVPSIEPPVRHQFVLDTMKPFRRGRAKQETGDVNQARANESDQMLIDNHASSESAKDAGSSSKKLAEDVSQASVLLRSMSTVHRNADQPHDSESASI